MTAALNILWASTLIDELCRSGVDFFCVSPGSRSTPLILALARHHSAKVVVITDERAAVFHALGYARGSGKPAVFICTSGTALMNAYPALVEASMDEVPLIIISADRPSELQDVGANQTIKQHDIFGDYLRWEMSLPCPHKELPLSYLTSTVDYLVHRSKSHPKGPVHLNCQFRKPFEGRLESSFSCRIEQQTVYLPTVSMLLEKDLERVADLINGAQEGLVILGHLPSSEQHEALEVFLKHLSWPVWADIRSGFRLGRELSCNLPYFHFLFSGGLPSFKPDVVLHFGGNVVSQPLLEYLKDVKPRNYLHISPSPFRQDPERLISMKIDMEVDVFAKELLPRCCRQNVSSFTQLVALMNVAIERWREKHPQLSEAGLIREITERFPEGYGLFIASSMSVRYMDFFGNPEAKPLAVASNRGVSGIDGTIASAMGFVEGIKAPCILLLGDLATLHDMNALSFIHTLSYPLTIIILNNFGGEQFSYLPVSKENAFERFFATPHSFRFSSLAEMFSIDYFHVQSYEDFQYSFPNEGPRHRLIEVSVDRNEQVLLFKSLKTQLEEICAYVPEAVF